MERAYISLFTFLGDDFMIYSFLFYFLLFIIYSILGWLMEVISIGLEKKKFINRGFLIGPYCPIYGFSSIIMILLFSQYRDDPLVLFILATVVCTFFEYITSFFMEKLFKARWWDYSHQSFNINGRVCLKNSAIFGILGCLLITVINPFVSGILLSISNNLLIYVGSVLLIAFLVDNIVSFNIISKFTSTASTVVKDNTEEITEKIKEILQNKSRLNRRLVNAFPDVKAKYQEQKRKIKEKIR